MPSNEREVPYRPRQWAQGDLIEAEKLKALENAVGAIDNDIVGNGTKITSKINQVVQVSENQPIDELNKVWVRSEIDSISVPTEEEFEIVKAKVKDANETIFYEKAPVSQTFTWHQGTIDETTGVKESSPGVSNAINTTISLPIDSKITKMHIENGYKMKIFKYAVADQAYIECDSQFVTGYRNTEDLWNVKFAILVMKSNEGAILVSNPPTISYINGYGYTDNSLTTQGRAADAKAVGDSLNTVDGRLMILEQIDVPTLQSIATIQEDNVAIRAYAVGEYFTLNNKLYKVTTAIAQNGTIIPQAQGISNYNCTEIINGLSNEVQEVASVANAATAAVTNISSSIATVETSTTASHAIAADSYFILDDVLYKATADIAIGDHIATTGTGANAAQVPGGVAGEIEALSGDVADLKSAFETGYTSITSAGLEAGAWDETGNKTTAGRVIRTKQAYPVKAGDYIETVPGATTLYWNGMVISNGAVAQSWGTNSNRYSIKNEKRVFTADGDLVLMFANGYNYGNSTSISPADMTATVKLYTSNVVKTVEENSADINSIQQDTQYIFTKKVDETETASSATFFYLPCQFEYGQTYVAKVTFSKFSSSSNRKYSLRTTTYQATSPAYTVQIVATVDGTAPVIGETYEYRFVADKRESGVIATYLVLEMSVNAESVCHVEAYSIKAEDNAHEISKLDYLTATDIVSLNHDAPLKILNGLKPFGRATTVPFSLLHFSDIHAAQTNLERLVQMGESLGANIDDVICTGDMVSNNYSATSMDFWNAVDGAENILMVVGNHDLADGSHGYSSDQIGQTVAYQTYFAPYISNWGVTMAGENLTYWYKDYAAKKVRLIGLNYLLTGDASAAQKTWLAARLAEAKTAGLTVVIAEHSPLNSFTQIDCNFNIIGKSWGYAEILADIQSAVQEFIDDGGEFACYIAGHSHSDYVGYNSNYPDQLCIVVTTAMTSGLDNDQRRVAGEKSQDAANVVLVDTVTKTVKLIRVGADMDTYLRGRHLFSIRYTDKQIIAQS